MLYMEHNIKVYMNVSTAESIYLSLYFIIIIIYYIYYIYYFYTLYFCAAFSMREVPQV